MATRFNYANARDHLLRAAMEVSPTGKEQEAFSKVVQNMGMGMGMAHASDKEICIELLGTMLDGLRNNNWPDPSKIV